MEQALKNRLTWGPLLMAVLLALLWVDHHAQVVTRNAGWNQQGDASGPAGGVGGIGLFTALMILLPFATLELATLFAAERVRPYRFISAVGAGLLVVYAFFTQFRTFRPYSTSSLTFIIVFTMLFAALRRAWARQTQEAKTPHPRAIHPRPRGIKFPISDNSAAGCSPR